VLKGNSLPTSLTDSIAKSIFFANLQKSIDAPEISGRITGPELQDGYRAWRETTSTSPSGLNLGNDKTMLLTTLQTDDTDFTAAYFDHRARMINQALYHRHVYKRWKTVITTMIAKTPGVPRQDKLRVLPYFHFQYSRHYGSLRIESPYRGKLCPICTEIMKSNTTAF
jgi:hypothetical protein